ncbi:MAG TPA: histidine phosphatase family protein [Patescibacteria group bacterium]
METKQTIIHFVRHGEVENPQNVRYGRLPGFHISVEGRHQAEQSSLFFLKRKISHIYSSPLERTQQTATLLGMSLPHVSITLDARILEVKTAGMFEGKSRDLHFYYDTVPNPDAEMIEQVNARMYHFVEEKIIQHYGSEIMAVSHGDPLAILFHSLVYGELESRWRIYPTYASIFSYVFEGLTLKSVWVTNQKG